MARSIRSTSPVMKNQFSCRPAACVKCDTHSKKGQKNPQISSERFFPAVSSAVHFFMLIARVCSSCFRCCLFEESVDHHSRCWCICGSLFFSKKFVRSRLSVGAFVVRCFFSKKSVRSPLSVARLWSVLFFHSRLARLWFDLCPNGPVGRVASLPDATRPCAGQVQIGIFRACGRGRRVSDCLCF